MISLAETRQYAAASVLTKRKTSVFANTCHKVNQNGVTKSFSNRVFSHFLIRIKTAIMYSRAILYTSFFHLVG